MTVSVIIPVYKVERFIERCVRSLMEQTWKDAEFIFVDDASPDRSIEILQRVASEYQRDFRVIRHETNRGLPSTRNTGLLHAKGDYIYHCDSDDWLETTFLEKMCGAAIKSDADFIYCDFFLSFKNRERYMSTPEFTNPMDALEKGFLSGTMKYNVWNKLVRRSVYMENGIRSPEEHSKGGEDLMMVKVLRLVNSIAHVPEALYHYNRTNESATTKTHSKRHFADIKANADSVLSFLAMHPVSDERYLQYFKLNIKLPLLFSRDRTQYQLWKEWYPEANDYISQNILLPRRTRMIQEWGHHGLFQLAYLYSWLIDLYYRIKYY